MNRWKLLYKGWALVWVVTLILGGLIFYTGYQSSLVQSSQESLQTTTSEQPQEVPTSVQVPVAKDVEDNVAALVLPADAGKGTVANVRDRVPSQTDIDKKELSIKDFASPVQGCTLRNVGNYYAENLSDYLFHAGTDYAEPEGTMIRATHEGKVISVGPDPILGEKITLDCGAGWIVVYGGLANLRVQDGETVETGRLLGQVGFFPGAEGKSGQPQLHYEVWYGDKVLDPEAIN